MKLYEVSYFYLATGMEGMPHVEPTINICAPSQDMAAYLYRLLVFSSTHKVSFEDFLQQEEWLRYDGLTIKELPDSVSLSKKKSSGFRIGDVLTEEERKVFTAIKNIGKECDPFSMESLSVFTKQELHSNLMKLVEKRLIYQGFYPYGISYKA